MVLRPEIAEKGNRVFSVFVKVGVEYSLIHKVRFAADVEENPSQVVKSKRGEEEWIAAIAFSIVLPYARITSSRPGLALAIIVKP